MFASNGSVAIPAGSRLLGTVVTVERGGKFKEQAASASASILLVLADGTRLPVTTETITRTGDPRGQSSAARTGGGAVVGAILGAIAGGREGRRDQRSRGRRRWNGNRRDARPERSHTSRPADEVTARILSPVTVTVENRPVVDPAGIPAPRTRPASTGSPDTSNIPNAFRSWQG